MVDRECGAVNVPPLTAIAEAAKCPPQESKSPFDLLVSRLPVF
jgi:hypothetical protein